MASYTLNQARILPDVIQFAHTPGAHWPLLRINFQHLSGELQNLVDGGLNPFRTLKHIQPLPWHTISNLEADLERAHTSTTQSLTPAAAFLLALGSKLTEGVV